MGASVKHLLGISGGKDSAALAIYLNRLYPNLDVEYYTCLLYTSPSPRDLSTSRMPSSA